VAALTRLQELGRTIPSLSRELGELQDEHGNFRLDAFALRLNEQYRGLPVFDHGYSLPCGAVKMPQGKGSAAGPTKAEAMVCWVRFNGSAVFRVRTWCSGADRAL
jgi:hypothetical protein